MQSSAMRMRCPASTLLFEVTDDMSKNSLHSNAQKKSIEFSLKTKVLCESYLKTSNLFWHKSFSYGGFRLAVRRRGWRYVMSNIMMERRLDLCGI